MKKNLLSLFILISISINAQDFEAIITQLSSEIKTVKTTKKENRQSVLSNAPGVIEYTQEITDSKGRTTTYTYVFNASDIDKHTIKTITKKDVIQVQLLVSKGQKLIKTTKNQEDISYKSKIFIHATNISNGRAIESLLKKAGPIAQKITDNRLSLTSLDDHLTWLEQNIGNVEFTKKQFEQTIERNDNYPGSVIFKKSISSGKSSKNSSYHFNFSTINPNSILFKIEGTVFSVTLETNRKLNFIKLFENNLQKNFTNKFKIATSSIENARDIQNVLKKIIPLSKNKFDASKKTISSIENGLESINNTTGRISINELDIEQSMTGNHIVTLTRSLTDSKKITEELYLVNFSDLNPNNIKYHTKGTLAFVTLKTKGNKNFIKYLYDNSLKNYTSNFKIYTPEVEDAQLLTAELKTLIALSSKKNDAILKTSSKENMLSELIETLETLTTEDLTTEQEITVNDQNLNLKITTISSKKSLEELYDFSLKDINSSSVKMKTSGKNVFVQFKTNYQEKIIQYYVNGEIKNYQNKAVLKASSIENGRKLAFLLQQLTKK